MATYTKEAGYETKAGQTVDYFLEITGTKQGKFKGETNDKSRKDQMDVVGWRWQVVSPRDVATGQASGKRQHKPLLITSYLSSASPMLAQAIVTNETLKSVTLFCRRGVASKDYFTIKMTNASISSYELHGGPDVPVPVEEFALTYQKIEIDYKPTNANGDLGSSTMMMDDWSTGHA